MLPRFQLGRFAGLLWCLLVLLLQTTATKGEDITEDPSTWFVDGCVSNPDTLTNVFGKNIPQTCIDVPYLDDGSQTQIYQRCYYTYVPDSCFATQQVDQQDQQLPLVMDLHGLSGCPLSSASYTGWMRLAEKDCFVLVWPSGDTFGVFSFFGGNCWNLQGFLKEDNAVTTAPCCCLDSFFVSDEKSEPDDPLFLKLAIDHLLESSFQPPPVDDSSSTLTTSRSALASITIDPNRVYMAGHSNGCMASMAMAALYPDSIAAVCCHAGAVVTPFPEPTEQSPSVPIFWVHGKKDATVPFDGQTIIRYPPYGALGFWSVEESLDYLSDHYGCLEDEIVDLELDNSDDNNNQTNTVVGTIAKRTNCRSNATLELMVLDDADHYPYKIPDSMQEIFPVDDGASPVVLDTTAMAWDFCRSHVKPAAPPQADEPTDPAKNITATTAITTQPPEDETSVTETEEESTLSSGTALRFGKSHERMLLLVLSWSVVVLGWVR